MATADLSNLQVGDEIPALTQEPVERLQLAKYVTPSGDHNRIHVDEEFAKAAGYPSVFAHGMLTMGFAGEMLTNWVEPRRLRRFGVRFSRIVWPGDVVTSKGKVTSIADVEGERRATLEVWAENQKGEVVIQGEAEVAIG